MRKASESIERSASDLLEALQADDAEALATGVQQATRALDRTKPSTLERELGDLLAGVAEELVNSGRAKKKTATRKERVDLCRELLIHIQAMAQLLAKKKLPSGFSLLPPSGAA